MPLIQNLWQLLWKRKFRCQLLPKDVYHSSSKERVDAVETIINAVVVADSSCMITRCNHVAEQLFGYTKVSFLVLHEHPLPCSKSQAQLGAVSSTYDQTHLHAPADTELHTLPSRQAEAQYFPLALSMKSLSEYLFCRLK